MISRWLIDALCISTLIGTSVSSCSEQEETDVSPLLSDAEITLSLPEWTPIEQSRATLYENESDLFDKTKGGGNFTIYAYVDATDKTYINGVRAWYFNDPDNPDRREWVMLDDKERPRSYYWPNSEKLNFFAFMPDSKYNGSEGYTSEDTHVEVLGYSKANGQQFKCELPAIAGDDIPTQEFIYAYEAGKTKQYEPLKLKFKHPFAIINFKLKGGSYRMTVKELIFNNIYLNGTFSTVTGEWTHTGERQSYTAKIDKRIPNQINYNSNLSKEWCIVMPQDLDEATLTLSAIRSSDKTNPTETSITETIAFGKGKKWEPGKKYTYIISYGDNNEEIYFNVEVDEDWNIGYVHNIDVE